MSIRHGRFREDMDEVMILINQSISFDKRLYRQDIKGSIAHAKMLAHTKILTQAEVDEIVRGLKEIRVEIESGKFVFDIKAEDIHLNIEKRLTEKIGDLGKKLHTARSRNDQVALDTRMWLKEEIDLIRNLIATLIETLLSLAEANLDVIMPGYTHLQRAQPVLFSHHLLAYAAMLGRDLDRLDDVYGRTDLMPLGAGALAGTTFPIDRKFLAKELGFSGITQNSLDTVSDRDFVIEFSAVAALLMVHLSRISEDLILWSSEEFDFVQLGDSVTSGSSIMPQKKNPDGAELVRGKSGRVFGNLLGILTVMKGLPLSYNKDMQEDKEGLFDTVDTVKICLEIYLKIFEGIKIKKDKMEESLKEGFTNATDMADYLVKKGLPFREAYRVVGEIVLYCEDEGKRLLDLSLDKLKNFSSLFDVDVLEDIDFYNCVNGRNTLGGTSVESVKRQIVDIRKKSGL